jgi:hypothetical protein
MFQPPIRVAAAVFACFFSSAHAAPVLVNSIGIAGSAKDLVTSDTANANRLGGFFSDMVFDNSTNKLYALPDRGSGGGLVSYETRVQTFALSVNPTSGAISNLNLEATTRLTQSEQVFNGLNPSLLSDASSGPASALGHSLDPECLVRAPNGNFFVADEYGPRVAEFKAVGTRTSNWCSA